MVLLGIKKKMCDIRKKDISSNCVMKDQFGYWFGGRNLEGREYKRQGAMRKEGNHGRQIGLHKPENTSEEEADMVRKNKGTSGMKKAGIGRNNEGLYIRESIEGIGQGNKKVSWIYICQRDSL